MKRFAAMAVALSLAFPTAVLLSGCNEGDDVQEAAEEVQHEQQEGQEEITHEQQEAAEETGEARRELQEEKAEEGVPQ